MTPAPTTGPQEQHMADAPKRERQTSTASCEIEGQEAQGGSFERSRTDFRKSFRLCHSGCPQPSINFLFRVWRRPPIGGEQPLFYWKEGGPATDPLDVLMVTEG